MNLLWLNASLIGAATLVVVPLLAHLFAKAKPPEFRFPSLLCLRLAERRTARLRRPKDWLLLALRTLAIAALVLAFLQPLLVGDGRLAAAGERKTMVLVVDRTASMGVIEAGRSRLAKATSQAAELLGAAGSNTLANIVWIDHTPQAVFPSPGANTDHLRDVLRRATGTFESGDVEAAFRLAMEQLGKGEGSKELYLLSDFQESAWKNIELSVPPNIRVFKLAAGTALLPNASVVSVSSLPVRPVVGGDVRLQCRVKNHSAADLKTTLYVQAGDTRQSRPLEVPAWAEATVEFRTRFPRAGLATVRAAIAEDGFPADDARFAVLDVRESISASVAAASNDEAARLWLRALRAYGWVHAAEAKADAAPKADIIVSTRFDAAAAKNLRAAAEAGATVIAVPGTDAAAWAALWGSEAAVTEELAAKGKPFKLTLVDDRQPLWALFRNGEFGDPATGSFTKRLKLGPLADSEATNFLVYTDRVPALSVRSVGKGHVVLWNLALPESESDWVQQTAFVPFVGEFLLGLLTQDSGGLHESPPGTPLVWKPGQATEIDQVKLEDERGESLPIVALPRAADGFVASSAPPPGSYRWLVDGQVLDRVVVNFPEAESDLRLLPAEEVKAGEALTLNAAAGFAAKRDGTPLWPWCLGLAIGLLMMEGFISGRPNPESREVTV